MGNFIVRYSLGIYSHKTMKLISLECAVQRLNKIHTKTSHKLFGVMAICFFCNFVSVLMKVFLLHNNFS